MAHELDSAMLYIHPPLAFTGYVLIFVFTFLMTFIGTWIIIKKRRWEE